MAKVQSGNFIPDLLSILIKFFKIKNCDLPGIYSPIPYTAGEFQCMSVYSHLHHQKLGRKSHVKLTEHVYALHVMTVQQPMRSYKYHDTKFH